MGSHCVQAQVDPIFISTIPLSIDESSGLEFTGKNSLWSHNDTDNDPLIINLDLSGNYIGEIELSGVVPVDLEDVAYDGIINFYVGEFGNNENDRTDLKIYKIPNPDLLSGSVNPELINFSLSDQSAFPPSNSQKNYDLEAMFFHNDLLHLFTRNRTNPYNGLIKYYTLDPSPGDQVAQLQTAYFANLSEDHASITAADISPDGTRIVLLSNAAIFIFTEYGAGSYFDGTESYNFFNSISPKEGVTFIDNCTVMISEESDGLGTPGNLYSLNTCSIVPLGSIEFEEASLFEFNYHNGFVDLESGYSQFQLELYNSLGSIIAQKRVNSKTLKIDLNSYSPGIYIMNLVLNNGQHESFKITHY